MITAHNKHQPKPSYANSLSVMLEENAASEKNIKLNFKTEAFHFLKFTSTMIWAFPAAQIMRWRIRKNKQLRQILRFKELLPVRNNIEKGSFAYDSLLFRENIFSLLKNKSHLANLVCLAILFGDEFIDGIAAEHGKKNIQLVLNDEKYNYYLQYKVSAGNCELYYEFDICDVLPQSVLNAVNHKYNITYRIFYEHLLFLLKEMNRHLNKLGPDMKEEAASLICKACNKCFDTFKEDIVAFNPDYSFEELQQYQKSKDDDIILVLLTLRAVLLNKKQLKYQAMFSGWSSMVRSMQMYDDMQDAAHDYCYQMNTLNYFAKTYFTNEWNWLQQNIEEIKKLSGLSLHASICLHMPGTVILLKEYGRHIALNKLNWVQRKIQNYLWRKNWLGFNNPVLKENPFCTSEFMHKKIASIPLKLHFIQQHISTAKHNDITEEMKLSLMVDLLLMDDELKRWFFSNISRKEKYYITSAFIELPAIFKATALKRILI